MKSGTYLEIDLVKVEDNSRTIVNKCKPLGVEVLGVTKGFAALPRIVEAMIRGGITMPTSHNLKLLIEITKNIEAKMGIKLDVVSGGGIISHA